MSLMSVSKGVVYFLLTRSCLEVGFCFSLCPFEAKWRPHSQSLGDARFHLLVGIVVVVVCRVDIQGLGVQCILLLRRIRDKMD